MSTHPPTIRTQLILPVARHTLHLAEGYVREVGTLAQLSASGIEDLTAAATRACRDVIELSYEPGEDSSLSLASEVSAAEVAITIQDRGLPLDAAQQSRVAAFDRLVDRATWLNHGPDGCELRLVKQRPTRAITSWLSEAGLTPLQADQPLAPDQHYDVRLMLPEEAIGVAQCIYRTYGYSYINKDVYFPDRFQQLHETGQIISAVAVDEAGELAGHCALLRQDLGSVAEIGQAVVAPAHRGRRLFERMRDLLMDEAGSLGLAGVFGDAVATHTYSQRGERDSGARPVSLLLGLSPAMDFKRLDTTGSGQRISCVAYFKALTPRAPSVAFVPQRHQAMAGRIYRDLGREVTFASGAPEAHAGQIRTDYISAQRTAFIRVLRAGADTAAQVRQARLDLCEAAGAEVVFLDLPLAQAGAAGLCCEAEADGFFFCGLGPSFGADGEDVLRLQFLNCELDPLVLDILEPAAQDLRDYIIAERERVGEPAAQAAG